MRAVGLPRSGSSWAVGSGVRFSEAFEETAAYLATLADRTTVTRLLGIHWRSLGSIIERVVARRLDPCRLDGIR